MKNLKVVLCFFLMVISHLLISCNDEPVDSILIPSEGDGNFEVTFDGQKYITNSSSVTKIQTSPTSATYQIKATFAGINNKQVVISFTENGTNTFLTGGVPYSQGGGATISLFENIDLPTIYYSSINFDFPLSNTGQINITSNDSTKKLISGNFSGTVYFQQQNSTILSKELTNGKFTNISYAD